MNKALYSSRNMCWCTPQDLFAALDAEFRFVLDAAATAKSAKCDKYYSPRENGLTQSWDCGGAVFCNPPYGTELKKWVKKACEEARGGLPHRAADPGADGYGVFSRLHIREDGNTISARAAALYKR